MNVLRKILFYVEPWIELSDDFRLGAYGHYNFLYQQLKQLDKNLDMRFLISDNLLHQIITKEPSWLNDDIHTVNVSDLETVYPNGKIAAHHNYHNTHDDANLSKLIHIIKKSFNKTLNTGGGRNSRMAT